MTKFKNRQGLALGSIIALLLSAFVGVAPAKAAAGDIILTPAFGPSTNYNAVQGEQYGFVLASKFKTGVSIGSASLSYKVELLTNDYTWANTNISGSAGVRVSPTNSPEVFENWTTANGVAAVSEAYYNNDSATYPKVKVLTQTLSADVNANNLMHIEVAPTVSSSDVIQVAVTAWIDSIPNQKIDDNETVLSETRTLSFHPAYKIAPSVAVRAVTGESNVSVTATLGGVNLGNFEAIVGTTPTFDVTGVGYLDSATAPTSISGQIGSWRTAAAYSTSANAYAAVVSVADANGTSSSTTVGNGDVFIGAFLLNGTTTALVAGAGDDGGMWTGSQYRSSFIATSGTVAANSVAAVSLSPVTSTAVSNDSVRQSTVSAVAVAEGTTSIGFTGTVWTTTSLSAKVEDGVDVRVYLYDVANGLDTTTLTAGGKTLSETTAGNNVSFVVETDLNGNFAFTVTADNGVAGETFDVAVVSEGKEGDQRYTVTFAEAAFTAYGPANATIATGGSFTANYVVQDQFGNAPADGHQLKVTRARASGRTTTALQANFAYNAPVVNGVASVTIVDNGSATTAGSDTITATLQKSVGGVYVNVSGATADTFTLGYSITMTSPALTAKVNNNGVTAGTTSVKAIALETDSLASYNSVLNDDAPSYDTYNTYASATATAATGIVTINGTLKNSAGTALSNVPVVVSGVGMVYGSGSNYYLDSADLRTNASGEYTFSVRGELSGAQVVTISAAGVSQTVSLTFATGGTGAANMAVTVPATSAAGKVIDVVVKVTDRAGRGAAGVAVTFKAKGVGYLNAMSATTDADGEAIVKLITLNNDSGTATITATATIAGVATSKAATVTVGAAAASSEQKVNAGSFKGYVALYAKGYAGQRMSAKVGKDWVVVESLASDFERVVEFTGAGYTISVPIYIDRVLVDTIVVTTK